MAVPARQMAAARAGRRGRVAHAVLYLDDGLISVCGREEPRAGWLFADRPVDCADCLRRLSR